MDKLKNYFYILIVLSFITSCGDKKESDSIFKNLEPAKGGRNYGGVFRLNESEYIKTLYPPNITDAYSYRVAAQIYEGLFKYDQEDLSLEKCLARSYELDSTGTVYTIKLRKGVYFHDDPCFPEGKGRELKASDVKYCYTQLCTQNVNNQGFSVFKNLLKGANKYYNATKDGKKPDFDVSGIEVIDDYTLKLHLKRPSSIFKYKLAQPFCYIYPKEAREKYGKEMRVNPVGTGAFYLSSLENDISIILKRNENYYRHDQYGNQLPYLDALSIQFIKDRKSELLEFKKGNLEMIYRLPTEYIIEILEDANRKTTQGDYTEYTVQREPEMATHFLTFNTKSKLFKNENIRKAFSYAIDRKRILEFVLNGEGYKSGVNGVTPPVFPDYNIDKIDGFSFNIDSAQYYLKKAGYESGKEFPKVTLDLNSDAKRNTQVAVEIQKQLKDHLNIDIELNILPIAQHVENIVGGDSKFFRIGWLADYPSPESFLSAYYGKKVPESLDKKSYPNMSRYTNKRFDKHFKKALTSINKDTAYKHFMKAEQIMINDAPIIILWYDEGYRLLQPYVKNFPSNAMQYRDFSKVYFARPEGVPVNKPKYKQDKEKTN